MMTKSEIAAHLNSLELNSLKTILAWEFGLYLIHVPEGKANPLNQKNGRKMPCEHLNWTQKKAFKGKWHWGEWGAFHSWANMSGMLLWVWSVCRAGVTGQGGHCHPHFTSSMFQIQSSVSLSPLLCLYQLFPLFSIEFMSSLDIKTMPSFPCFFAAYP